MFGIASFNFVLLLINDWQLAMQVNIRQSFFANPLQQPFTKLSYCQSFLLYGICLSYIHIFLTYPHTYAHTYISMHAYTHT